MAFHLLRSEQRFHLNPFLIRILSTSSSNLLSQLPSNFFTKKPLVDRPRKYSGDVFDRFAIRPYRREKPDEIQSRVSITEQPKEEKRRRPGRPKKKQLVEKKPPMDEKRSRAQKPMDEKRSRAQKPMDEKRSRAASIGRKTFTALGSSSRNALKTHPDYICSVTHAMDVLNSLPRVKKWSPLYRASMDHLMADVAHRQAFLTFSDPEDMIRYLRYKTRKTERE